VQCVRAGAAERRTTRTAASWLPSQTTNQPGRRFLLHCELAHLANGAQAEAYATEKCRAFDGAITPKLFAGHGMPCPY
jgi:hypothetical protein